MIGYTVVCDHPGRRWDIADIDDDRPDGGYVHLRIYRGFVGTRVAAANKRGSRRNIPLVCGADGCTLNVELEETSVPEVIDRIAPHRALLPLDEEGRHIVAFDVLCRINSQLRARGRH